MQYENPEIPEGINVSREHHLKEFALLTGGAVAVVLAVALLLGWAAELFAARVPFSYECEIAGEFAPQAMTEDPASAVVETELQTLADTLAAHMRLPAEMRIRVHYVDDADTVNAFATLGGHIVVFRGLLARMPSENALAMVLAHEIAHVLHRDPIVALGRGMAVGVALAAIAGVSGDNLTDRVFGTAGTLTALSFSRDQERTADAAAIAAIAARYGHVADAAAVFESLADVDDGQTLRPPEFLSSHPGLNTRRTEIGAYAAARGWPLNGTPRPLPPGLRLQSSAD